MYWNHSFTVSIVLLQQAAAFGVGKNTPVSHRYTMTGTSTSCSYPLTLQGENRCVMYAGKEVETNEGTGTIDSYETSDVSSKGLVSSLTGMVNLFMGDGGRKEDENDDLLQPPPQSPSELMEKIREDYVENNYLWTGNIYLPAFEPGCTFTDPTLSFVGTDKFVSNVKNLVPIVDFLKGDDGTNKSELLNIDINEEEGYVETRWNMVGDLNVLPWKPAIDVIGRTKFWYRAMDANSSNDDGNRDKDNENGYRVYFYDEAWELEATTALLQLVTPKGRIPNSTSNVAES